VTWARFVLLAVIAAILCAGAVALLSRTTGSVRGAKPDTEERSAANGASFSDAQIARHGAYRRPNYAAFFLSTLLTIIVLVLIGRGPFSSLVDRTSGWRGGWFVQAMFCGALLTALLALVALPLSFITGFVIQHAWDLSNQSVGAWLTDQLRFLAIGGVISAVSAAAFFGIVRWKPDTWWLWGWAAFSLLTVALVFLFPVVIAPLFNRFTPLEEGPLRTEIIRLGDAAGVPLDEVLVADASKRSSAENAYVAGLGATKQLVLYDTLLEAGTEEETLFVVAHELGHKAENHVLKNVVISSAGLLVGFGLLFLLSKRQSVWAAAGAEGIGDVRALPLLVLFLTVMTLLVAPIESGISRHFERQADSAAIALTDDPVAGVSTFRRLAFSNLADLRPPAFLVGFLFSHPPIPDRIESLVTRE
jgi:STE24 endopeptidase